MDDIDEIRGLAKGEKVPKKKRRKKKKRSKRRPNR